LNPLPKIAKSGIPLESIACFTVAALAGRKVILGSTYKLGSIVASVFGKEVAEKWDQAGDHYLALAKKDRFSDLTAICNVACL